MQNYAHTVVNAETGQLNAVDEADKGDVIGGVNATVEVSVVSDGVAGVVELGVVDVSRVGDVDQVRLPVQTRMISRDSVRISPH